MTTETIERLDDRPGTSIGQYPRFRITTAYGPIDATVYSRDWISFRTGDLPPLTVNRIDFRIGFAEARTRTAAADKVLAETSYWTCWHEFPEGFALRTPLDVSVTRVDWIEKDLNYRDSGPSESASGKIRHALNHAASLIPREALEDAEFSRAVDAEKKAKGKVKEAEDRLEDARNELSTASAAVSRLEVNQASHL